MNIHVFIQARIGSTRLPGKVLNKILEKTVIELTIERARQIKGLTEVIVVTGQKQKNLPLINELEKLQVKYFCGSENNVLDRFYKASLHFQSNVIIRITADCPLIEPDIISKGLDIFQKNDYDILSVNRFRTFPHGINFEIFNKDALEKSWKETLETFSSYEIFENTFIPPTKYMLEKKKFKNYDLKSEEKNAHIRITLDYPEDFELIKKIFESLYIEKKYFSLEQILDFLKTNPELLEINKKYVSLETDLNIEK